MSDAQRIAEKRIAELEAQLHSTRNTLFARATDVQNLQAACECAEKERDRARARAAELEFAVRKIHDRAHEWNAIPLCVELEQMAFDALGLKGGA